MSVCLTVCLNICGYLFLAFRSLSFPFMSFCLSQNTHRLTISLNVFLSMVSSLFYSCSIKLHQLFYLSFIFVSLISFAFRLHFRRLSSLFLSFNVRPFYNLHPSIQISTAFRLSLPASLSYSQLTPCTLIPSCLSSYLPFAFVSFAPSFAPSVSSYFPFPAQFSSSSRLLFVCRWRLTSSLLPTDDKQSETFAGQSGPVLHASNVLNAPFLLSY